MTTRLSINEPACRPSKRTRRLSAFCILHFSICIFQLSADIAHAQPTAASAASDADVLAAEKARIETIERISRPTIAIYSADGNGGGSGVVISADGYALTNFHVAAPTGPALKVGLSDGRYVDAVLVGLDPGGDVALIKLLGKEEFPDAELGDSDT